MTGDARTTWVALLRAVNLGPRNRVPMAELRDALVRSGFSDVRTYIASGNVLFGHDEGDEAALARTIERIVDDSFGVRTTAILRRPRDLAAIVAAHPFGADTSHSHVTFLAEEPTRAAIERLAALDLGGDDYRVVGRDVLLHYPNGVQGSRLTSALLERELGVVATNRTWKTVTRLAELAA